MFKIVNCISNFGHGFIFHKSKENFRLKKVIPSENERFFANSCKSIYFLLKNEIFPYIHKPFIILVLII